MQNTENVKIENTERLTSTSWVDEKVNEMFKTYVRAMYPDIHLEITSMVIKDIKTVIDKQ